MRKLCFILALLAIVMPSYGGGVIRPGDLQSSSGTPGPTTFYEGDGKWATPSGGGSVSSVGLTVPGEFTLSGSPITSSGTFGLTWSWETPGSTGVFLKRAAGAGSGVPSFGSILYNELPAATTSTQGATILETNSADTSSSHVVTANDSRLSDSRAPNGTAGGDLGSTFPNPTVGKIQGVAVSSSSPSQGQTIVYDSHTSAYALCDIYGLKSVKAVVTSNVSSLSGTTTLDGVSLSATDCVLLTGQSTGSQNGLWLVQSSAWTRPACYDTGVSIKPGAYVWAMSGGTSNGAAFWYLSGASSITVDTTSTTWTKFSGGGSGGFSLTDGTNTVNPTTALTVAGGGVVSGSTPNATLTIGSQVVTSLPAASSANRGQIFVKSGGGITRDSLYISLENAGGNYIMMQFTSLGIDPSSIAGLVLWLKADAGITLSGSNVTGWADQSGNSNNFSGGVSPTIVNSSLNGLPVVRFNGSSQYLDSVANSVNTPFTMFVAHRTPAAFSNYAFLFASHSSAGVQYGMQSNQQQLISDFVAIVGASTESLLTSKAYCCEVNYSSGGAYNFYTNGVNTGSGTNLVTFTPSHWALGFNEAYGSQFANGDVAEILVYNSVLSTSDRQAVEQYLNSKWNLGF